MKKRIAILGSTGSIGKQALEVIDQHPDKFELEVLSALKNTDLLIKQAIKYKPNAVVIGKDDLYTSVSEQLEPYDIKVYILSIQLQKPTGELLFQVPAPTI